MDGTGDQLTDQPEGQDFASQPKATPIKSRFLFVDVAAHRAKQLRRGALPRLSPPVIEPKTGHRPDAPHKLERIAMEEVRGGLIEYFLPPDKAAKGDSEA